MGQKWVRIPPKWKISNVVTIGEGQTDLFLGYFGHVLSHFQPLPAVLAHFSPEASLSGSHLKGPKGPCNGPKSRKTGPVTPKTGRKRLLSTVVPDPLGGSNGPFWDILGPF